MSYSEQVLEQIIAIRDDLRIDLFDATIEYCDRHDIDVTELMEGLDKEVHERLKHDAVRGGRVRKCVFSPPATLV